MKASIYLNESYKNESGESMVYLRVFINKKYLLIPLDIHVAPCYFDKEKQRIVGGKKRTTYNHLIKDALGRASNIILKYKVNDTILTRDNFEREFKTPEILTNFYAFMEHEIKKRRGDVADSTIKQHTSILNKMKEFRDSLLLIEIDENFLIGFRNFLKLKKKNRQNTVHNAFKVLRVYINKALKQELIQKSPFEYFKVQKEKTYPEFLTDEEIKLLIDLYKNEELPEKLHRVLRWFLFGCQTGLRIADLRGARHEDIKQNILYVHPKKTKNINNKRVEIPLNKLAKQLIKDECHYRLKGLLFNCISEQKMNKNLKKIIEQAEFEKEVTFHTARHTFATLFLKKCTKANGILILQKLLGHSKIETTMIYSHILNDDIKNAMEDFNF